jgi:hypothetical protein
MPTKQTTSKSKPKKTTSKSKSKPIKKTASKIKTSSKSKSKRVGPSDSATLFPKGTIKKGNDGNKWVVIVTKNKIKKWQKISTSTSDNKNKKSNITFDTDANIISLDMGGVKIRKLRLLTKFRISSNQIGVGELLYHVMPAKKGEYNIYELHGSLMAIRSDDNLVDQTFKLSNKTAYCDIGSFAFNDSKRVEKYIKRKSKVSAYGIQFPYYHDDVYDYNHNKKDKNWWLIFEKDLQVEENNPDADDIAPLAVMASNNYGDGSFPIYKCGYNYMILSSELYYILCDKYEKNRK